MRAVGSLRNLKILQDLRLRKRKTKVQYEHRRTDCIPLPVVYVSSIYTQNINNYR